MEKKNLLRGNEFLVLQKKVKELGARSLDYSNRKNNKYVVTLQNGKQVHFGSPVYEDFLIHKNDKRREKYLKRTTKIRNKKGDLTYNNLESPNFWSINLLW